MARWKTERRLRLSGLTRSGSEPMILALDDRRRLDVAALYGATWASSTSAYVVHHTSAPEGRWAREPVTPELVLRALTEGPSVSFGHPGADGRTHLISWDVDVDGPDGWEMIVAIARAACEAGVPTLVDRSARAGHAHARIDGRVSAAVAWQAAKGAIVRAGLDAEHPHIEVRPHSPHPTGLGRALRPPLMRHPRTGERHPLLDPFNGQPVHGPKVASMLLETCAIEADVDTVRALAATFPLREAPTPPGGRTEPGESPIDAFNAVVSVSTIMSRDFGVPDPRPGRALRCVAPGHEDRHPSLSILPDDRRVVCHAPGCILAGRGADAWALARFAREWGETA